MVQLSVVTPAVLLLTHEAACENDRHVKKHISLIDRSGTTPGDYEATANMSLVQQASCLQSLAVAAGVVLIWSALSASWIDSSRCSMHQ